MIFNKGFLFYQFYNIRLFFFLLFKRFDILVSNDLDTLPANFLVSKILKRKLVFDSHEYFTGVPELSGRTFVRWVWKTAERMFLPGLKYCMTVSGSLADQYTSEYGINPAVVRNCSRSSDDIKPFTREEIGIRSGQLLLILQGTGINKDRGGEELIDSLLLNENHSLLIIGSGEMIKTLKDKTLKYNLSDRVKFFPKMPWNEMMHYTKSADAGVSLDKNKSMNQKFSLPNKIFDYISAGIPVIAGDLPEVTKIVASYSCGIIIPEITPNEISQAVSVLHENNDLLRVLKQNAREASSLLTWETESEKVREFYRYVMGTV